MSKFNYREEFKNALKISLSLFAGVVLFSVAKLNQGPGDHQYDPKKYPRQSAPDVAAYDLDINTLQYEQLQQTIDSITKTETIVIVPCDFVGPLNENQVRDCSNKYLFFNPWEHTNIKR